MAGVTVTPSMGLYLLLPDHGMAQNNQGQNDQGIKLGILNGTYSVHITGYVPDSSATRFPLRCGRVTHFANGTNGTESAVATVSVNGQLQTITFTGTLTVNPDGVSWSETVTQTSRSSLTLHYILYPTPDGNTINEVETDPGTTAAGILTRGTDARRSFAQDEPSISQRIWRIRRRKDDRSRLRLSGCSTSAPADWRRARRRSAVTNQKSHWNFCQSIS